MLPGEPRASWPPETPGCSRATTAARPGRASAQAGDRRRSGRSPSIRPIPDVFAGTRPAAGLSLARRRMVLEAARPRRRDRVLHRQRRSSRVCSSIPARPDVWAGVEIDGVFRSLDGGDTWTKVVNGLNDLDVHDMALARAGPPRVYVSTNGEALLERRSGRGVDADRRAATRALPYARGIAEGRRPARPVRRVRPDHDRGDGRRASLRATADKTWQSSAPARAARPPPCGAAGDHPRRRRAGSCVEPVRRGLPHRGRRRVLAQDPARVRRDPPGNVKPGCPCSPEPRPAATSSTSATPRATRSRAPARPAERRPDGRGDGADPRHREARQLDADGGEPRSPRPLRGHARRAEGRGRLRHRPGERHAPARRQRSARRQPGLHRHRPHRALPAGRVVSRATRSR